MLTFTWFIGIYLALHTDLSSYITLPHHPVMTILKPKASQNPFLPPVGPAIHRKYHLDTAIFRN